MRRLDCLEARKMRYEFYKRIGEEKLYQFAVSLWMDCAISSVTKLKESKIDNYTVYVSDIKKEMRKVLRMEMKFKYIKAKRKIGHLIKYFIVQI